MPLTPPVVKYSALAKKATGRGIRACTITLSRKDRWLGATMNGPSLGTFSSPMTVGRQVAATRPRVVQRIASNIAIGVHLVSGLGRIGRGSLRRVRSRFTASCDRVRRAMVSCRAGCCARSPRRPPRPVRRPERNPSLRRCSRVRWQRLRPRPARGPPPSRHVGCPAVVRRKVRQGSGHDLGLPRRRLRLLPPRPRPSRGWYWNRAAMPWCSRTIRAMPSGFWVATAIGRPASTKASSRSRIPG